jgi:hypothetical protein
MFLKFQAKTNAKKHRIIKKYKINLLSIQY